MFLLLPACATGARHGARLEDQRHRLQAVFAADLTRGPALPIRHVRPSGRWIPVVDAARRAGQEPQEPVGRRPGEKAIDDVVPAAHARGVGYRDAMGFREPSAESAPERRIEVEVGVGEFGFDAKDTQFHDRTGAMDLSVVVSPARERAVGAGVRLDGFASADDLFHGETIYNGEAQKPADATAYGLGMFPHAALHPGLGDRMDMPVRLGLFVDWMQIHHQEADVRRNWFTFGPRIEVEPQYRIAGERDGGLSAFLRLTADYGGARFHETWTNGDDSAATARWMTDVGGGLRWHWGGIDGELGYRYRTLDLGRVDSDLWGGIDRARTHQQGVFLSLGSRF
ncbi:MAG: hypothetical protein Fur0037_22460 [Planctomycetota bacterium]